MADTVPNNAPENGQKTQPPPYEAAQQHGMVSDVICLTYYFALWFQLSKTCQFRG